MCGYDLTIQHVHSFFLGWLVGWWDMEEQTNTKSKTTLTAYSISLFSHEQLCKIATAPVKKKQINTKRHMNKCGHISFMIYDRKTDLNTYEIWNMANEMSYGKA